MTTTLVRGATVVDGTGSPPRRADILVRGDRIADVGLWERVEAGSVVDADGLVATPGFIDTHFHGDLSLFADPIHACTLRQGVTTVILGQDGLFSSVLDKVGTLTRAQAEEIAKAKGPDLTAADLEAAVRTIAGSARSMGITVEGI